MNDTIKFLYLYFLDRYKLMHLPIGGNKLAQYYARSYIEVYGCDACKTELKRMWDIRYMYE